MDRIEVKRPVVVKVIMTDDFRHQLQQESTETMKRIDDNLQTLLARGNDPTVPGAENSAGLEMEKDRLGRMKMEIEWKLKEVDGIQNDVEVPYRVLEGPVTLAVGDDFLSRMTKAEIVIKDWKVVEIRQS
jgi:hypothetical protein